ncbi:MAG: hypothetical protein QOK31_350 [Solirubrobacteraceae bacterium]|jgi:hypothetical protein|nr:hypothetical protein [Solirubrobacteraceae bacterium]MEA2429382.1 hypothetical protein [Thermoleophilaceae bacterium]
MSLLVWIMMAIALWHFTVWLPDRFWGGIVGALLAAIAGSVVFGLLVSGFTVPGQHDTHLFAAIESIPGTLIGLGLSYWYGMRQESAAPPRARRA